MNTAAFPPWPKLRHGSLTIYPDDAPGTAQQRIDFQYNPGEIRRTLAPRRPERAAGAGAVPYDARLVAGPPTETLALGIELDATDQLGAATPDANATANGLHQPLAALEMLMYPPTERYERGKEEAGRGRVAVQPANLPLVLLNWGAARIVPVMLTSFAVTEQEFDPQLNPLRARIELGLQVLTYLDLDPDSNGVQAFIAYQREKKRLAGSFHSSWSWGATHQLNTERG